MGRQTTVHPSFEDSVPTEAMHRATAVGTGLRNLEPCGQAGWGCEAHNSIGMKCLWQEMAATW